MSDVNEEQDAAFDAVHFRWGIKIPLSDGVSLSGTLYLPKDHPAPSPVLFTFTPYVAQRYHDEGLYFAEHGYPFLAIDVRGRGNSDGCFEPYRHEGRDGSQVVEWLARQAYCNGQVAMWGASYAGFNQWAVAKELPPNLVTIVPVASPYLGVDVPGRGNIPTPYLMQWLTLVSGKTSQDNLFWNRELFWGAKFRRWLETGIAFKDLDEFLGNPSAIFQEWLGHPDRDAYWDSFNPTDAQYAQISLPILSVTGIYDADQAGALAHYQEHLQNAAPTARDQHYLVIGPWDHGGTRTPRAEFAGLKAGPASLLDLKKLHLEWYGWTLGRGSRPVFLQNKVAYYVMGAEKWRYADTLKDVTSEMSVLFLHSTENPTDVFRAASLVTEVPEHSGIDQYVYDPRDMSLAGLESKVDPDNAVDQRMVHAAAGRQLVYHRAPFDGDTEITGFFRLSVWLAIDQPDTDLRVAIYDVGLDGSAVLMTHDVMRARYRESLRQPKLISTQEPLRYEFEQFMFVSRVVRRWHRLRLIIGPINSIYSQRNCNAGGIVAEEGIEDARAVKVNVFHDRVHPSALYVPLGQPETGV